MTLSSYIDLYNDSCSGNSFLRMAHLDHYYIYDPYYDPIIAIIFLLLFVMAFFFFCMPVIYDDLRASESTAQRRSSRSQNSGTNLDIRASALMG